MATIPLRNSDRISNIKGDMFNFHTIYVSSFLLLKVYLLNAFVVLSAASSASAMACMPLSPGWAATPLCA